MKKFHVTIPTTLFISVFLLLSGNAQSNDYDDDRELRFSATLTGAQEVTTPAGGVDTDGKSMVSAKFDAGLTQVVVRLRLRNLSSPAVAAHFHCARPGLNGPVVFGLVSPGQCEGLDQGKIRRCTLTNADFTGADCNTGIGRPVNNIAALAFAMRDGLIYTNVHTPANPGGEVRGQMLGD
jgi:hypothetical protein